MSRKKKTKKKYRGFWVFVRIQAVMLLLVLGGMAYYFFGGYAQTVSELSEEAKRLVRESTEDAILATVSGVFDAAYTTSGIPFLSCLARSKITSPPMESR